MKGSFGSFTQLPLCYAFAQQDLHKIFHAKHKYPLNPGTVMLLDSAERRGATK